MSDASTPPHLRHQWPRGRPTQGVRRVSVAGHSRATGASGHVGPISSRLPVSCSGIEPLPCHAQRLGAYWLRPHQGNTTATRPWPISIHLTSPRAVRNNVPTPHDDGLLRQSGAIVSIGLHPCDAGDSNPGLSLILSPLPPCVRLHPPDTLQMFLMDKGGYSVVRSAYHETPHSGGLAVIILEAVRDLPRCLASLTPVGSALDAFDRASPTQVTVEFPPCRVSILFCPPFDLALLTIRAVHWFLLVPY